jgi:hypothetical protein
MGPGRYDLRLPAGGRVLAHPAFLDDHWSQEALEIEAPRWTHLPLPIPPAAPGRPG